MQVEYIFVMKYGRGMPVVVKYVKKYFFQYFTITSSKFLKMAKN